MASVARGLVGSLSVSSLYLALVARDLVASLCVSWLARGSWLGGHVKRGLAGSLCVSSFSTVWRRCACLGWLVVCVTVFPLCCFGLPSVVLDFPLLFLP